MSIASPEWAPSAGLDRVISARRLLVLALFLGLSFAAVAAMNVNCRDEPNYILSATGHRIATAAGSGSLLLAEQRRVCRLALGKVLTLSF
jgi:hypothetical protein